MSSRKPEETRAAILDAARALYEQHAAQEVGLGTVAKHAGVSRQAIYLHFESKADLLRAMHERVHELDVEPALRGVWLADNALDALDRWIDGSAEAIPKFLPLATSLEASLKVDPDVAATWEAPASGHYDDCVRLARWLAKDKALAKGVTVAHATDVIWMLTGFWSYENLVVQRRWTKKKWKDWLRVSLRELLLVPSG